MRTLVLILLTVFTSNAATLLEEGLTKQERCHMKTLAIVKYTVSSMSKSEKDKSLVIERFTTDESIGSVKLAVLMSETYSECMLEY